jgi:hypothetical protein
MKGLLYCQCLSCRKAFAVEGQEQLTISREDFVAQRLRGKVIDVFCSNACRAKFFPDQQKEIEPIPVLGTWRDTYNFSSVRG